jgi:hypothetical protein
MKTKPTVKKPITYTLTKEESEQIANQVDDMDMPQRTAVKIFCRRMVKTEAALSSGVLQKGEVRRLVNELSTDIEQLKMDF